MSFVPKVSLPGGAQKDNRQVNLPVERQTDMKGALAVQVEVLKIDASLCEKFNGDSCACGGNALATRRTQAGSQAITEAPHDAHSADELP